MKDKILQTAKELFIKNGYNETTTRDIVKYSGSSKGNLYYHFKTKENLFLEILKAEDAAWYAKWHEEEAKCQNNREKFYRYNELTMKTEFYYPLQTAIIEFYSGEHESSYVVENINSLEQHYINTYNDIFCAGNDANEWQIEDVETVSQIAASTVNGIITFTNKMPIEQRMALMTRFSQIFLKGLH